MWMFVCIRKASFVFVIENNIFFVNVCVSTLLSHRMCVRCMCVCVCVRMCDALATETPEGSLGMCHIPLLSGNSGLSFDSPFLPPPFSSVWSCCSFCLSFLCSTVSLFCSCYIFIFLLMAHSLDFFSSRKFFTIFH